MKKLFMLIISTVAVVSFGFATGSTVNVHADEVGEAYSEKVNERAPYDTPYIVNVLQLDTWGKQVQMFADYADSERNITTETSKIYLSFNFVNRMITKHTYVYIIEDTTNLPVLQADMGKGGTEHLFDVYPKIFRANQHYTIYHQYGSNARIAVGRFKVTAE